MMSDPVEVIFPVEQDESGYPPVTREAIWCIPIGDGIFVVDNIPFYATDISMEDEIRADRKGEELWYSSLEKNPKIPRCVLSPSENHLNHGSGLRWGLLVA